MPHPAMPESPPEPDALSFQWGKPARKARGLAFWVFVVVLALAAFFYLFQVVYPQSQRFTPVPHHIIALNPSDPAAREILNKVQDLDFLILPTASDAAGSVNLDDRSPVFHPTFEGHTLQLQDLPQKTFSVPPARLLQVDAPVLPPLDLKGIRTEPLAPGPSKAPAAKLKMRLAGPLASRAIARPPELSGILLNDAAACRFQLGVRADGSVEVALPLASTETSETTQKLGQELQAMRFAPSDAKTQEPTWGTATFEWSKTPP
jgi:hypothetical protein